MRVMVGGVGHRPVGFGAEVGGKSIRSQPEDQCSNLLKPFLIDLHLFDKLCLQA